MRRADRLFRLVELLRSRRLARGAWLAEQLQISLRTLYRDIRDLSLSGIPIEGEAGVGYRLQYKLDVPPLLFDTAELEALLVGSRMVQAWGMPISLWPRPQPWPRSITSCPKRSGAKHNGHACSPRPCSSAPLISPSCAVPFVSSTSFRLPTPARTEPLPSGQCGRSDYSSGESAGRSSPGAGCAENSAISGWTASTISSPRRNLIRICRAAA